MRGRRGAAVVVDVVGFRLVCFAFVVRGIREDVRVYQACQEPRLSSGAAQLLEVRRTGVDGGTRRAALVAGTREVGAVAIPGVDIALGTGDHGH
jgi:hypothetical protein